MCIVDNGNVDEEEEDSVVVLAALCILSPKIKEDVPIKKETTARIFPVKAGMKTSGNPWVVCGCDCCSPCCCCCAAALFIDNKKNTITKLSKQLIPLRIST